MCRHPLAQRAARAETADIIEHTDAAVVNHSVWEFPDHGTEPSIEHSTAPFAPSEPTAFIPGSVVRGFDDLGVEPKPPPWASTLHNSHHPRVNPDSLPVHEMPPANSPKHPLAHPEDRTRNRPSPRIRNRYDWAAASPSSTDWVANVHKEILNYADPADASRAHMYVAANALSVLKTHLEWRSAAASASEEERAAVAEAVLEIATAAQHWPTHHMHEDLCMLLSRLQELAVSYCPEALAV